MSEIAEVVRDNSLEIKAQNLLKLGISTHVPMPPQKNEIKSNNIKELAIAKCMFENLVDNTCILFLGIITCKS